MTVLNVPIYVSVGISFEYTLFPSASTRLLRKVRKSYKNWSMTSNEFLLDLTRSVLLIRVANAQADTAL
ncbi:MAG: hypothetical protein AAGK03_19310 [Pseudomonadota bacterium]